MPPATDRTYRSAAMQRHDQADTDYLPTTANAASGSEGLPKPSPRNPLVRRLAGTEGVHDWLPACSAAAGPGTAAAACTRRGVFRGVLRWAAAAALAVLGGKAMLSGRGEQAGTCTQPGLCGCCPAAGRCANYQSPDDRRDAPPNSPTTGSLAID